MNTRNDWFFALFDPFQAWYDEPSNPLLAVKAAEDLRERGRPEAANAVLRRQAQFDPYRHVVLDDSFIRRNMVMVPCSCGDEFRSLPLAEDHVRAMTGRQG